MDPMSIHLKNIDSWEVQVLMQVFQMEVSAEGRLLTIQGNVASVGDVTASYGCLQRAEITDERNYVGG